MAPIRIIITAFQAAQGLRRLFKREPNRGYFLAKEVDSPAKEFAEKLGIDETDVITDVYFRIADDRLRGLLPAEFTETLIKQRYNHTPAQLTGVLGRVANERWAEKKPGYGWIFSRCLRSASAFLPRGTGQSPRAPAGSWAPEGQLAPMQDRSRSESATRRRPRPCAPTWEARCATT